MNELVISKIRFSIFLIALCSVLKAGSITTSVTCGLYGQIRATTGTSFCSEGTPPLPPPSLAFDPPFATATASGSLTLQTVATDWISLTLFDSIQATDAAAYLVSTGQLPWGVMRAQSFASASSDAHFDFYTDGPLRQGILQVQFTNFGPATEPSRIGARVSITGANFPVTFSCGSYFCDGPGPNAPPIPIALGTSFSLDGHSEASGAFGALGSAQASIGVDFQFRILDSDGITPVLIHTGVPEPRVAVLFVIGLGFLAAWRAARQRSA